MGDFPDQASLRGRLRRWAILGRSASNLPWSTRPTLILVPPSTLGGRADKLLNMQDLRFELGKLDSSELTKVFGSVILAEPLDDRLSASARFLPLERLVQRELDALRQARIDQQCLFSARHLTATFCSALAHLVKEPSTPFNFVKSACKGYALQEHNIRPLSRFLQVCINAELSCEDVATSVASGFMFRSCSTKVHRKAQTTDTFVCSRLFRVSTSTYIQGSLRSTVCASTHGGLYKVHASFGCGL